MPDWSLRAQQRMKGGRPEDFERRQELLHLGEARLAAGDAAAAEAHFDRAALMLHAADTEIALVRTYVQLGQFRRALAFCAHTAGVHRDVVSAAALYAWLLHLGGQAVVALQRLAEAERLYPGETLLAAVRAQITSAWPRADGALRMLPARMAPYAPQPLLPPQARCAGTASLLPDGISALAPAAAVAGAHALWLRNGLGQTVAARVESSDLELGLALLVADAWPALPVIAASDPDPFGGRPGYTAEYPPRDDAEPDWPLLRLGFLGPMARDAGARALGLDLPPGPRGGPVLDEAGRWAGIALQDAGRNRWLTAGALRARYGARYGDPAGAPAARIAPDEAYERALRLALQILIV